MRLVVTASPTAKGRRGETVSLDAPDRPAVPEGGGRWVWIGPLPSKWIDLGDGYALALRVVRSSSVRQWHAKDVPKDAFECPRCDRSFRSAKGLEFHERMHREGRTPTRSPPGTPDARLRRRDRPEEPPSERRSGPDGTEKWVCRTCGQEFISPSGLGGHRKKHRAGAATVRASAPREARSEPPAQRRTAALDKGLVASVDVGAVESAINYQVQGHTELQIASRLQRGSMDIRKWLVKAYGFVGTGGIPGFGPDPKFKAVWETEMDEAARTRFAARVLKGE